MKDLDEDRRIFKLVDTVTAYQKKTLCATWNTEQTSTKLWTEIKNIVVISQIGEKISFKRVSTISFCSALTIPNSH